MPTTSTGSSKKIQPHIHFSVKFISLFLLFILLCSCTISTPFNNRTTRAWKKEFSSQYPDVKVSFTKSAYSISITFTAQDFNTDDQDDILRLVEELLYDPDMVDAIFSSYKYTDENINAPPGVHIYFDYDGDTHYDAYFFYGYRDGAYR